MKRLVVGSTFVVGLGWLLIGVAHSGTPFAGQFQVNTYTTGSQGLPAVAIGPGGEIVITWTHIPHPDSPADPGSRIQAQRYDRAGTPQGGELQVNACTTCYQSSSSVAFAGKGDFVVVWQSSGSSGTDNDSSSVQGQRFDSAGAAVGGEFQVNTYVTHRQEDPAVAADSTGHFVVVWESRGSSGSDTSFDSIQAQRYDSFGLPVSGELQVNTYTTGHQTDGAVAIDGAGNSVVVWTSVGSPGSDTSDRSIQGQRFDSTGAAVGGQFQVNTYTTNSQAHPAVTTDATGNFLVVWDSFGAAGSDAGSQSLQGQLFDSSGAPVGGEFQVNSYTTASQYGPRVGTDGSGHFVAAWQSRGAGGSDTGRYGIQARTFSADGTPVGDDLQVDTYTVSPQVSAALAVAGNGDFVVAWQSQGSVGDDKDSNSIQARRFSGPLTDPLKLTVTGVFNDESMDGFADPGETIDYTYELTRPDPGFAPLTDVDVTDPDVAPILCPSGNPIPSLGGKATETCAGTYVLTQADADAGRKDTATTVDSAATGPLTAAGSVPLAQSPAVGLVKTGLLDLGGDGIANPGDLIDYLFDVTNTGTVTLTGLTVSDPLVAPVTCPGGNPLPSLAPGATETCTGSYAITPADIDAGVVLNTATVTAGEPGGASVDDQDSHSEPIPRAAFACDGEVYIIHETDAVLSRIDQGVSPFTFIDLAGPVGREINNLGFNAADGLLYGIELLPSGNVQLIQIDATGAVFGLGRPPGLPSSSRFDGGDVSTDGSTMYVTANNSPLYRIALPALTVTSVTKSGATGFVFDWAYNPADGLLYGGDSTGGQLAVIDPDTGVRSDFNLAGLPTDTAYGGAWFDGVFGGSGHLFLYRNNGEIYEIDVAGPTVVDVRTGGPASSRNDGAACIDTTPPTASVDLVKTGTLDLGGNGTTDVGDVIDYTFEITNTGTDPLTDVTVDDPTASPISCPGGHPILSLAGGASVTCTGSYAITQADVDARVKDNTAGVSGKHASGPVSAQDSHSEAIPAPPGAGPVPFACTEDAYIVQNQNAQLALVDRSVSPFVFVPIGGPTGIEINNLGFRATDGLLYAVELSSSGNVQVIQIDATGAVFGLGRPAGLPTFPRFDAGDVSPDGATMYVTANNQDLYVLDLTGVPALPAVTSVAVTGASGFVFDWAVSPVDGKLYGGDSSQGQLAILDPATGVRSDVDVAGLPSGAGYGGAWFNSAGTLFLYQNDGNLYEIDLAGPGPTVVSAQTGAGASRNDGAACIDLGPAAAIELVKTGALDLGGNGTTDVGDVIDYTFQITNAGTGTLTGVTLSDPLIASFTCPGGAPGTPDVIPSLPGGATVTCTASYAITQADVDARVRNNTATVTGTHASGPVTAEDSHSESIPAPPGAGPIPFGCTGDAYIVQDQSAQLTRVDQSVSPFVFVSIGGTGIEINNLGFRKTDGLLYAVELSASGNVQVIQLDATGTVFGLGRPAGLPVGLRFDAGDVSPDGTTMYITTNNQALYVLDLTNVPTLPAVTPVAVTGATGYVFDWAVSPIDGKLYGGDSSQGQLAILDPATGVRTDVDVAGLPAGNSYGGAWFGASGTLFLFQNSGAIYEIDLSGPEPSGPTVVNTQLGPGATRNDGAACIELAPVAADIGLTKTGTLDLGGNGTTDVGDVIDYTFEVTNQGTDALTNVTISDPSVPSISCPGGHPMPTLAGGTAVTCIGFYAITQADVDARVKDNTAEVTGDHPSGAVSDQDSHSESIPAPPGAGPMPFACSANAYIVQNQDAELTFVDQSVSPFVFVPVGGPTGIEINNLGFRVTDGLLYAVELSGSGNVQIIQIDSNGDVFGLGRPAGLPTGPRFDAGDVSPDGSTMYITSHSQALYALDLTSVPTLPAVTSVNVTGATGFVFDWAVSPVDGKLYGGDSSSGQLASIDPTTGARTDVDVAGLPSGSGYGGAWFDTAGTLFLYQNSGVLYEIDLAGPTVVNTQTGPGATRNDGAACIDPGPPAADVSLTKTGALDLGGNGTTDVGDVIDYTFEVTNPGTDALTNVTISDPAVPSISCPGGHPILTLASGATVTCSGSYAITRADVDARVKDNTAAVTGGHPSGAVSDQDSHSESIPAPPGASPVPFACTGDAYIVQNQNAQLTRIDLSVSPFVFVPIGTATGIEINNLGFRKTDGLLYAVELTGSSNVQIIQIDATGNIFGLGRPPGLPTFPRFDAGDVSPDGTTMYITSNNQALYRLDLTSVPSLPAVTSVAVTGPAGHVFDWAVSPVDGKLYGGDSTSGQLAIIDPATGVRTDVDVAGLPSGDGYGGAWFDNRGRLFLYRNSGATYEIDLAGPIVVNTQNGSGASRNDAAACIPERQVNTFTANDQTAASVALDAAGDFVVVWQSDGSGGTDASGISIQGQRYESDGSRVGGEFQVNIYTTGDQRSPSVALDADGDFVVVWESPVSVPGSSIQGRRYASDGSPVGGQFQVDAYNTNDDRYPSVAVDADGDFVVVWHSVGAGGDNVHGRRYASDGSPVSGQLRINTYTTDRQRSASVALDADGDFVVVWTSHGSPGPDSSDYSVQGQRYASDGSTVGGQFQINTYTTNRQRFPSVSLDTDGDFVVVWYSRGSVGTDSLASYSVQGQRYASDGSTVGGQFQVNTYTTGNQRIPSVSLDADGDFVVVWDSTGSGGTDSSDYSVQGQRYASDGSTLGGQFQVNTYTTMFQIRPAVSLDADGDFVVVWDSTGSGGTDSSGKSIQKTNGSLPP